MAEKKNKDNNDVSRKKEELKKRSREIAKTIEGTSDSELSKRIEERSKKIAERLKAGSVEMHAAVRAKTVSAHVPTVQKKPAAKPTTAKQKQIPKAPAKACPFPEAVKTVKKRAKGRKFTQTWDLAINMKGINLKRPENRFAAELALPAGRGRTIKVCVIADTLATEAVKQGADVVVRKDELEQLANDKKRLKTLARDIEWFYGEMTLMTQIGKKLGIVLGPRGKIPKPVPPKADIGEFLKKARNTVRITLKDSPVIHVPVGNEKMKEEDIVRNIEAVYEFVKEKLPKGVNSIRSMYLKLTMGEPVKLEVK